MKMKYLHESFQGKRACVMFSKLNARVLRLHVRGRRGFSLLEVMIALVVMSLLASLAYPSYVQYVRKSKRAEAQRMLMNWSVNQEVFRANNPAYANSEALTPPAHDDYSLTVSSVTAGTYTLSSTALGDQLSDHEKGTSCGVMTIDQNGIKSPIECWNGRS